MIRGNVTAGFQPLVELEIAGRRWTGLVDTGFNGWLELPYSIGPEVSPRLVGRKRALLASAQSVVEDVYAVEFPFDGRVVMAEATFTSDPVILMGCRLLSAHRLNIEFPARTFIIERVTGPNGIR